MDVIMTVGMVVLAYQYVVLMLFFMSGDLKLMDIRTKMQFFVNLIPFVTPLRLLIHISRESKGMFTKAFNQFEDGED